jgi:hypothetical protein
MQMQMAPVALVVLELSSLDTQCQQLQSQHQLLV